MRFFFFSCAVLCATQLVGALPSAISPDSLEDKHPIGKRQDSYLTADVQQPLNGECTYSDVSFFGLLWALATERNQDRIASSSSGASNATSLTGKWSEDRITSSSTGVSNAASLTGKWKKMGDCSSKQVQIQDFSYDYLQFSTYSSHTRFEIHSGERLIAFYSLLMSGYSQTVDVASTSLFHATKKGLVSAKTQLFKTIAHIRAFGARMSMPLPNYFPAHPKTLTASQPHRLPF